MMKVEALELPLCIGILDFIPVLSLAWETCLHVGLQTYLFNMDLCISSQHIDLCERSHAYLESYVISHIIHNGKPDLRI